jgi:Flp pilus assembly pilin Flp
MSLFHALIASVRRDEEGQGLAEYALILALIAIVAIIALIFLGQQVSTILSRSATRSDRDATLPLHAAEALRLGGVSIRPELDGEQERLAKRPCPRAELKVGERAGRRQLG